MFIKHSYLKKEKKWGVAWSSGQHRRLPLQESEVQILTLPLFSTLKSNLNLNRAGAKGDDGDDEERGEEPTGERDRSI